MTLLTSGLSYARIDLNVFLCRIHWQLLDHRIHNILDTSSLNEVLVSVVILAVTYLSVWLQSIVYDRLIFSFFLFSPSGLIFQPGFSLWKWNIFYLVHGFQPADIIVRVGNQMDSDSDIGIVLRTGIIATSLPFSRDEGSHGLANDKCLDLKASQDRQQ